MEAYNSTVASRSINTPAHATPIMQNVGDIYSQTYTQGTAVNGGASGEFVITNHRKFLGFEQITVPAGTFNACKFEDTIETDFPDAFPPIVSIATTWTYAGGAKAGLLLKANSSSSSGGISTSGWSELLSATLPNGAILQTN